jgi:3-hydroxy-5-methyl-1-naphthoate 3-O-methyltransferase
MTHAPVTDPTAIYRYRESLTAVDALTAAIAHLDLFTALADSPADLAAICRRFSIHARPTDTLCTLLVANGLMRRGEDGILHVTDTAREFLVSGSPFDARPYYASIAEKPGVADFLTVLRTDRPANWPGEEGEADWHAAMRTEAFAESFTAAMDCRGRVLGPGLAAALAGSQPSSQRGSPPHRLLDIGGGSGVYAIAVARAFPETLATVLEASPVDGIARRTIAAARLGGRIDVVTADMFADAWPADHDTHLFSNVLHDWNEADCRRLLGTSVAALPDGGRLLVHDMLLDDDKSGPLWAAEYSVLLTTVTQGRLYSAKEIGGWLADLGMRIVDRAPTALGRSVLIARRG